MRLLRVFASLGVMSEPAGFALDDRVLGRHFEDRVQIPPEVADHASRERPRLLISQLLQPIPTEIGQFEVLERL